jgi:FkbM family methyltransferase
MKTDKLISNKINYMLEGSSYPINLIMTDENSIAVDCGSNLGGFVLNWHQKFKKIFCYEASKYNYECFIENTKSISNKISIENKAVSADDDKILKLRKYTTENGTDTNCGNFGCFEYINKINNHGWKNSEEYEEVYSISLPSIIKKVGNITLLKVDIEGSEYDFLINKDLSRIEYITMELHNFLRHDGKQKNLIDFISKTHNEIYSTGNGIDSHFVKLWKIK